MRANAICLYNFFEIFRRGQIALSHCLYYIYNKREVLFSLYLHIKSTAVAIELHTQASGQL